MLATTLLPELFLKTLPYLGVKDLRTCTTIAKDFTPAVIRTYKKVAVAPFFLFIDGTDEEFAQWIKYYIKCNNESSLFENLQKRYSTSFAQARARSPYSAYDYKHGLDISPEKNPLIIVVRKFKKLDSYQHVSSLISILETTFNIIRIVEIGNKMSECRKVYKLASTYPSTPFTPYTCTCDIFDQLISKVYDLSRNYPSTPFTPHTCICDIFDLLISRKDGNWFGRIPIDNVHEIYKLSTGRKFPKVDGIFKVLTGRTASPSKARFSPY